MPGQRVKADILKQIVELKSRCISNRTISSTLKVNRNTVNNYIRLYATGLLDDQFKIKETKSYLDKERLLQFCEFVKRENADLNSLSLWRKYRLTHEDGYGYTHFYNLLKCLKSSIKFSKATPVLFCGTIKDGALNKETGEIRSASILCLLFPSSGLYFISKRSELDINFIVSFLELTFRNLGGRPSELDLLPYSLQASKFNSKKMTDVLTDWLELHNIKSVVQSEESMTKELWNKVAEYWKKISEQIKGADETNSPIESNLMEKLTLGLSRSLLFDSFDNSKMFDLPLFFRGVRKIISAKVQKMSHVFLAEDKHYYSVPSKFIGQRITVKYCSETVTIYGNESFICTHGRNTSAYKYTTDKLHINGGKGWTQEYFINMASVVGPSTKLFIQKLINRYDSPNAAFKQANAILLLKNTYHWNQIERACSKVLPMGPHTYHRLRRELELSMTF